MRALKRQRYYQIFDFFCPLVCCYKNDYPRYRLTTNAVQCLYICFASTFNFIPQSYVSLNILEYVSIWFTSQHCRHHRYCHLIRQICQHMFSSLPSFLFVIHPSTSLLVSFFFLLVYHLSLSLLSPSLLHSARWSTSDILWFKRCGDWIWQAVMIWYNERPLSCICHSLPHPGILQDGQR